jgi:hypothetical protein
MIRYVVFCVQVAENRLNSVFIFRCFREIAKSDYYLRHVCPSIRFFVRWSAWNISAPNGRIFMKFYISVLFENLSRKLKFHLHLTKITGTYMKTSIHLCSYLAHFFLEWEIFQTNVVENFYCHCSGSGNIKLWTR